MGKIQEKQMKNIEEINKESVKKILTKKKYLNFLLVTPLRLELGLLKANVREFSILREFALRKRAATSIHHLQFAKFHLAKVLNEHLLYTVQ